MLLSEFDYHLPTELIAQNWAEPRDHSRLLILNPENKTLEENKFFEIEKYLWVNDVLVLNKTKVINARLKWYFYNSENKKKECEIFLHKQINDKTWDCLVFPWKKLKIWKEVFFEIPPLNQQKLIPKSSRKNLIPQGRGVRGEVLSAKITKITDSGRKVEFNIWWIEFLEIIEKIWNIPTPPYIKEKLEKTERYQTVYNEISGSVAAPTAWLHFTKELFEKLEKKWVKIEKVLLHVGLGTFKNVETENIKEHKMHSEYIELSEKTAEKLNKYKSEWKRIIAVWTTSIRVLESFSDEKWVLDFWRKDTDIFIFPWYKWKFVDSIITNFHLPKSTLLMLISSFAWKKFIKKAYSYAIKNKFRFFSFWDAMWIKNKK